MVGRRRSTAQGRSWSSARTTSAPDTSASAHSRTPTARVLGTLGRAIVPGADEAGLAHYLDQQLSVTAAESFLMLRYLDVPPPYADFYRPALASVDRFDCGAALGHALTSGRAEARALGAAGVPWDQDAAARVTRACIKLIITHRRYEARSG